eukprot:Gb_02452 [translate_table: standard]
MEEEESAGSEGLKQEKKEGSGSIVEEKEEGYAGSSEEEEKLDDGSGSDGEQRGNKFAEGSNAFRAAFSKIMEIKVPDDALGLLPKGSFVKVNFNNIMPLNFSNAPLLEFT